ncbi:hypothetical protein IF2G_00477 [Cordyceps javanica]|nr:hypothetical protein IF2G_00477 [Cordyceps javanica]
MSPYLAAKEEWPLPSWEGADSSGFDSSESESERCTGSVAGQGSDERTTAEAQSPTHKEESEANGSEQALDNRDGSLTDDEEGRQSTDIMSHPSQGDSRANSIERGGWSAGTNEEDAEEDAVTTVPMTSNSSHFHFTTEELAGLADILAVCPSVAAEPGSSHHIWARVRWADWSPLHNHEKMAAIYESGEI